MGRLGRRIGDVEPFAALHEGAATTVYKGYQPSLDRFVLLKVLKPAFSADEALLKRFEEEAQLFAKISHPNVATVYSYGREEDRAYLVTEFVEGRDLRALLEEEGALPAEKAVDVALQAARALQAAHAQGVLHRDLKPANLLLTDDGHVKLTDFGMASLSGAKGESELRGTPGYLAPELYKGEEPSAASDLFAFGATFYAMLTGRDAFAGSDTGALVHAVLHHDPIPGLAFHAEAPPAVIDVLSRLLAKDPADRYEDAEALADALENCCTLRVDEKKALPPPVVGRKAPVFPPEEGWRRYWHLEYAALLLVLMMAPVLGWGVSAQPDAPEPETPAVAGLLPVSAPPEDSLNVQPVAMAAADSVVAGDEVAAPPESDAEIDVEVALKQGYLRVLSEPAAEVFVNGEPAGEAPLDETLTLSSGRHQVVLKRAGFPDFRQAVYIRTDETNTLNVSLWETVARLDVQAAPWAYVYLNGQEQATTPLREPLVLRPGSHTLTLRHPSFGSWDTTFTVQAGGDVDVVFNWRER